MKISARNVLAGKVTNVTKGAVNSEVTLTLQGGENMVAIITNSSVDTLGLRQDTATYAIIKASDVMIGKGNEMKLSARNVLAGEVAKLQDGAVNSEVEVRLAGGTPVVAAITKESVKALDLHQGDKVSAIIKASHVLLGV
ncbi:TOBE domain-containing protein [Acidicapsa acidisoli]|uniref:TOBE domain-containing protein n=1 Tax=Acidicapsa acidisoli TaxID=1615681 RepID=UPI0021E09C3D|nr:TOBE domain-containing protein [Acidicapsa acidisoli]